MVHLDLRTPKHILTEKFFKDEGLIKKFKRGFGFVNFNLQGELRHLVLGLNTKSNIIWEYNRDEDDELNVYQHHKSFNLGHAVVVYKN